MLSSNSFVENFFVSKLKEYGLLSKEQLSLFFGFCYRREKVKKVPLRLPYKSGLMLGKGTVLRQESLKICVGDEIMRGIRDASDTRRRRDDLSSDEKAAQTEKTSCLFILTLLSETLLLQEHPPLFTETS